MLQNKSASRKLYKISFTALLLFGGVSVFGQQKFGDNLGNHQAVKPLDMNGNSIDKASVVNAEGVVIGTASAVNNTSVALQVNGTDKAILLPRVTDLFNATSPSIANPLEGMMVYDVATRKFYIRNNSAWVTYATMSLPNGMIFIGNSANVPQAVAVSGDITINNTGLTAIGSGKVVTGMLATDAVTSVKIADGNIITTKVADQNITTSKIADANVTPAKLAASANYANKVLVTDGLGNNTWADKSQLTFPTMTSGQVIVANASGTPAAATMSGDVTISNAGATTIGASKVVNGMIATDAVTTLKIKDANVIPAKLATSGSYVNKVLVTDGLGNNTWADKSLLTIPTMTSGQVIVANSSGTPAAATMSGDVTISNAGATTIGASKVVNGMIAADAVTTAKIADNSITNTKITDASITTAKIADVNITTNKIADANVTPSKLATSANYVNKVLVTDGLGNNTWADKSQLTFPTMTSGQVIVANASGTPAAATMSGDVTISNAGATTIGASKVVNGMIAADAVTNAKIADNSVTNTKIADASITTAKIADVNITTNKIADANVTPSKLATSANYVNKVLVTDGLGNNTWADKSQLTFPTMTSGQVIVANASGTPAAATMSGDVTISNAGATTIGASKVANGMIATDAVTTLKIKDANVTPAKLATSGSYVNKVLVTDGLGNNTWADKSQLTFPTMTSGQVIVANASGTPAAATMSGDVTISNAGATTIGASKVVNGMIASDAVTTSKILDLNVTTEKIADANVTPAKLAASANYVNKVLVTDGLGNNTWADKSQLTFPTMTNGQVIVANASGTPAAATMSGDVTISNAGATTIGASKVVNGMIATDAVTTLKIKDANVTPAKLATSGSYVNKVLVTDGLGNNTWADKSQLTFPTMTSGQVIVANASGTPAAATMSGDVTISNAGATTIGASKVVNGMIASDAVTTSKILDLNVTTDKIADANITPAKLAASANYANKVLVTDASGNNTWADKSQLTFPTMTSGQVIVANASGTPAAATMSGDVTISNAGATTIGAGKVVNGMLAADAVTTVKITDGNVTTNKIADANITTVKIANANVTPAKLATSANYINKVLVTDGLGNNTWADKSQLTFPTMTSGQVIVANASGTPAAATMSGDVTISNAGATTIGASKVVNGMLASDAVTTSKILDLNVTTDKIADANITPAKLAASADYVNKVLVTDASGNNTWADKSQLTFPTMTSGQVIVANASGTPAAATMSGDVTISNAGATTIGAGKVGTNNIASGSITSDKIASGAVTTSAIASPATGDVVLAADASQTVGWINKADLLPSSLTGKANGTSTISNYSAVFNAKTATYTLDLTDNGKIITVNNSAAVTIYVPSLATGFNCMIIQTGNGVVSILPSPSSGVVINNRLNLTKTAGVNAVATIIATSATSFITSGDMQ
ncbi:beta strand repeat-containing protein [Pararcticibacter amylolyticus]|uniref:Uncharacterized protein n=1 Tax=Pararcticibacter amylolyticus TaxID=2173175 RepID=A0A2U2PBY4_9SPHI|nr:hypothetical protein [Pararcticibacter amylolyticus]PWG78911.1 hypothetical protein DDR33_19860 [Pararcticibacter amylolyticus]